MSFSLKLKELREKKGLSQAQLANELHVGVGSVGMWESTQRTPPAKRLQLIADYFGVTVDELLGRDVLSDEERAAGASLKRRIEITPLEDDLLYAFREVGKKFGEPGQRAIIAAAENMLKLK